MRPYFALGAVYLNAPSGVQGLLIGLLVGGGWQENDY